jgi:predicted DNA-binding transcriptional regulator AlpA
MSGESDFLIPNKKAAALLGVGPRTLFTWVLQQELDFPRPIKVNGRRYFSSVEIEGWRVKRQNPGAMGADRAPKRQVATQIIPPTVKPKTSSIDRNALEISGER